MNEFRTKKGAKYLTDESQAGLKNRNKFPWRSICMNDVSWNEEIFEAVNLPNEVKIERISDQKSIQTTDVWRESW